MNTISDGVTTIDVPVVNGFEGSSEAKTIVHETLTGGANYTHRPAGAETGTLSCVLSDDTDAAALYALARTATSLTLVTGRAGVGMDFVVAGSDIARSLDSTTAAWVIAIPFQEIL